MIGKAFSCLLKAPIWAYRWLISPVLPVSCRFQPTCSGYAIQAIDRHGPFVGAWLALVRIGRCHPWGGCGFDPVPERVRLPWRPVSRAAPK